MTASQHRSRSATRKPAGTAGAKAGKAPSPASGGAAFGGFSPAAVAFWEDLPNHNQRDWFEEHRGVYEREVLPASKALVEDLGQRLREISPAVHADPRVNRSLFRIFRDTRFSPDKSPYKTHLGLWWWEGEGPRMDCSGYYFHLEPPRLFLAAGMHIFPRHLLTAYRQQAADPQRGRALLEAVEAVQQRGCQVGGLHYQRLPRGVDPGLPQAELLRHNGLYSFYEEPIPQALYSADLVEHCFQRYLDMAPLHQWLVEMTLRAAAD